MAPLAVGAAVVPPIDIRAPIVPPKASGPVKRSRIRSGSAEMSMEPSSSDGGGGPRRGASPGILASSTSMSPPSARVAWATTQVPPLRLASSQRASSASPSAASRLLHSGREACPWLTHRPMPSQDSPATVMRSAWA